jgi:hypothetical protein
MELAWKQPQYVVRAGMFHSVYGTFDYRYGVFDLRKGRGELTSLIGAGAEELAFGICTSDRIGLLSDILGAMYGYDNMGRYGTMSKHVVCNPADGNPAPPLIGELNKDGFLLRNHITQKQHIVPADYFAQFIVVMVADFMDQGVVGVSSADMDICLFQFMRYRFYNDILRFVAKHLRSIPPAFKRYMWDKEFIEPTRSEILRLKQIFAETVCEFVRVCAVDGHCAPIKLSREKKEFLCRCIGVYPYILETRIMLAVTLAEGEIFEVCMVFWSYIENCVCFSLARHYHFVNSMVVR